MSPQPQTRNPHIARSFRTAGLVVELFPLIERNMVGVTVYNTGPTTLNRDEARRLLQTAIEQLDDDPGWRS